MQSLNDSSAGPGVAPIRSQLSDFSSEKGSRNCAEHPEVSSLLESQETESKATRWTDEKHSLYIKSMEASFVNQLYNSLDMLGWCPNEEVSSDPKVSGQKHNGKGTPTPSGQVFRDGSWARINFRKETTRVKKVAGSGTILANPWIKHYKSSCSHSTSISTAFQERAPLATDSYLQVGHQDSVGSNSEVTDQNFVDEVSEEEKPSRMRSQKCRKISKAASSGNDQVTFLLQLGDEHGMLIPVNFTLPQNNVQVVPVENLSLVGDVAEGKESSKE